jgi:hypothetical protein
VRAGEEPREDPPDVAALAARAEADCDLTDHMAGLMRMLGQARRRRLAPPVTAALCAAAAALGARPAALYLAGRGSGPAYATDTELRADCAQVSAELGDAAADAEDLAALAGRALAQARAGEQAAAALVAALTEANRGLPAALADPGALDAAKKARWDAAWRAGEAARISGEAQAARAGLVSAAARLDAMPRLLSEEYEPLYEIVERPGGRLPDDPDFITGTGPDLGWVPVRMAPRRASWIPTGGGTRERSA